MQYIYIYILTKNKNNLIRIINNYKIVILNNYIYILLNNIIHYIIYNIQNNKYKKFESIS